MTERVWDQFLTEQDKTAAAAKAHRGVGAGSRPALLLIDLYRWVFGDKPQPLLEQVKDWPSGCGLAAWEALPHIQRLLATAREVGIPIVHMTWLNADGLHGWSEAAHQESSPPPEPDPAAADRKRRAWDIVDEVAPQPGELVLRKSSPSAFWGTPLVGHLRFHDIDTLVVAGESTSGCVRASVVDGCTNRFRMMVAEECVFDRHEAPHAINLFDMNQKYADVVPVNDAIAYLRRIQAEREAAKELVRAR